MKQKHKPRFIRGAVQTAVYLLRTLRNNKKALFLLPLNFILIFLLTSQVMETATSRNLSIQILEPFIWVFGDTTSIFWCSLLLLFLLSDLPCLHPGTPYLLIRITRKSWLLGQMVYTATVTFFYLVFTLLSTVLLCFRKAYIADKWSRLALLLSQNASQDILPVSMRTMEMSLPGACAAQVFLLLLLYALCLSMLVLVGNLSGKKGAGVIAGILYSAYGILLTPDTLISVLQLKEGEKYKVVRFLGWFSPLSHAAYPRHSYGYDMLPTLQQSWLVFFGLLVILAVIAMIRLKRYAFSFRGMDES